MHTILVVDDEEVVRSVVRDMLESDVVMPLMKGPELATKLLAVSPSTKVLLMSAYPMSEVAASGRAFISKPFSVQGLNAKVRQVLEQSSPFARPTRSS